MGISTNHTIKALNKRIHSKYQIDRYHCHINFQTLCVEHLTVYKKSWSCVCPGPILQLFYDIV